MFGVSNNRGTLLMKCDIDVRILFIRCYAGSIIRVSALVSVGVSVYRDDDTKIPC